MTGMEIYPPSEYAPSMRYPSVGPPPSQSGHLSATPTMQAAQIASPMQKPFPLNTYDYAGNGTGPSSATLVATYSNGGPAQGSQEWSSMRPGSPRGYASALMMPPVAGAYSDAPGGYYAPDHRGYAIQPQLVANVRAPLPGYGMAPAPSAYDPQAQIYNGFQSMHPGGGRTVAPAKRSHHKREETGRHAKQEPMNNERPVPTAAATRLSSARYGAVAAAAGSGGASSYVDGFGPMKRESGSPSEFITKLYKILSAPEDDMKEYNGPHTKGPPLPPGTRMKDLISWQNEDTFMVKSQHKFELKVLPTTFRHANFASFVRQLNKYGFTKVPIKPETTIAGPNGNPITVTPQDAEGNPWQMFKHKHFLQSGPHELDKIKRKQPAPKKGGPAGNDSRARFRAASIESGDPHSSGEDRTAEMYNADLQAQLAQARDEANYLRNQLADQSERANEAVHEAQSLNQLMRDFETVMERTLQSLMSLDKTLHHTHPTTTALSCVQAYNDLLHRSGSTKRLDAGSLFDFATPLTLQGTFPSTHQSSPSQPNGSPPELLAGTGQQVMQTAPLNSQQELQSGQEAAHTGLGLAGDVQHNGAMAPSVDGVPAWLSAAATNGALNGSDQMQVANGDVTAGNEETNNDMVPVNARLNQLRKSSRNNSIFAGGWTQRPRILVVEDDPICREVAKKFLSVMDCEVDMAVNGGEAVKLAKLKNYEVCFMDIHLPIYSGDEATAQIRMFNTSLPIISMTSDNDLDFYRSRGMTDHIAKPLNKYTVEGVLVKYAKHLVMRRVSELIPPTVGVPPVNDEGLQQAVMQGASEIEYDGNGNIVEAPSNTMGGMGIPDEVFTMASHNFRQNGSLAINGADLFAMGNLANFATMHNTFFVNSTDFANGTSDGLRDFDQDIFSDAGSHTSWSANAAQVTELN